MIESAHIINEVGITSEGHTYIFFYRDNQKREAVERIRSFVYDERFPFTWREACLLAEKVYSDEIYGLGAFFMGPTT